MFPGSLLKNGLGTRLGGGIGRIQTIQGICYKLFHFNFNMQPKHSPENYAAFIESALDILKREVRISHTPSLDSHPQLSLLYCKQ